SIMNSEIVNPNVSNFITALRDIGYSLEIAIADVLDNSISAKAKNIKIFCKNKEQLKFEILDNGNGMTELELVEAMRLGSKNPLASRTKTDLGRFGLGLKTASFSQCKKLTVFTKKDGVISNKQWDLNYIENKNEWRLKTLKEYSEYELVQELDKMSSGTLVIWEEVDRLNPKEIAETLTRLRNHLSLVFHKFLEKKTFKISINENELKSFDPFNIKHPATQELPKEEIKIGKDKIVIQPFILPHHSKVTQQEYNDYATSEGYLKAQGFYLYRANRLLIHGTWFGLHKASDAHKLVRIKIEIPNNNDVDWGIDVKKSTAKPADSIKENLKRTVSQISVLGSRPYTGRGRKIEDKKTERFWNLVHETNKTVNFKLNLKNEIYQTLNNSLNENQKEILSLYLNQIQEFLPLDSILSQLQQNPHDVVQKKCYSVDEKEILLQKLKDLGLDESYLNSLETFKF
ncbi:ATP-binding protein, partial [Cetobacterium sp.]|uniref:ATP-binding protein n=1 Tax=Cetobacterium sp. TaxID=2071632 RepID=UPI003F382C6A